MPVRIPSLAALALGIGLVTAGCEPSTAPQEEPTEPWKADEAPSSSPRVQQRIALRARASAQLPFALSGRELSLRGSVPLLEGELRVDPEALEHVRGELVFSLDRLELRGEEGQPLPDETLATQRALGLGVGVAADERARAAEARFRIAYAHQLTARAASRGALVRREAGGEVRRVVGLVEGELQIRGIEVHHTVRVQLDFRYAATANRQAIPQGVHVTLLDPDRVSLLEHEIEPRDEAGRVLAVELDYFRKQLSRFVRVTGALDFERMAPGGESAAQGTALVGTRLP